MSRVFLSFSASTPASSQLSPRSASDMTRSDNICAILNIKPLLQSTCAGLNQRGQPCGCLVARASRVRAFEILGDCDGLHSDSRQLRSTLKKAAELLLCKRWHQHQWREIVADWLEAWTAAEADRDSSYGSTPEGRNELVLPRPVGTTRALATNGQSTVSTASESSQSAYQNLVMSVLNSNIANDLKISILQAAAAANTPRAARPISPPIPSSSHTRPIGSTRDDDENEHEGTTHSALPAPPALPPPTEPIETTVESTPPPPLRESHTECCICFLPYDEDHGVEHFECDTCQNRVHLSCHQTWVESSIYSARCTYCRALV